MLTMIDTIRAGAARGHMSDDTLSDERKAQALIAAAVANMRSALQDAALLSSIRHDEIIAATEAFNSYVHDDVPDRQGWDDALVEARNG